MSDFNCIQQIIEAADTRLDDGQWAYVVGGSEAEAAIARNRRAIERHALVPRILRKVADVNPATEIFGHKVSMPVMLAPLGSLEVLTEDAAAASMRAGSAAGIPTCVSSVSSPELEATRAAGDGPAFYQLYIRGDRDWLDTRLDRVMAAGYNALIVTVDLAWYSVRDRQLLAGWKPPTFFVGDGREHQYVFDWEQFAHVRRRWAGPLVIKGIQSVADAQLAVEHGADGVWISNHGGRGLDHVRGSTDVLADVAAELHGKAELFVDGGYMRGTDILKAMALGARAVAVGRLQALALGAGGSDALTTALDILKRELAVAMGLLGVNRVTDITSDHICPDDAPGSSHLFSGFPTLKLRR